jgi:hypothetical protein
MLPQHKIINIPQDIADLVDGPSDPQAITLKFIFKKLLEGLTVLSRIVENVAFQCWSYRHTLIISLI